VKKKKKNNGLILQGSSRNTVEMNESVKSDKLILLFFDNNGEFISFFTKVIGKILINE
jgi:hypothetical protein